MKTTGKIPDVPKVESPYLPKGTGYIFDRRFFDYFHTRKPREDYPARLEGETKEQHDKRIIEYLARKGLAIAIVGNG